MRKEGGRGFKCLDNVSEAHLTRLSMLNQNAELEPLMQFECNVASILLWSKTKRSRSTDTVLTQRTVLMLFLLIIMKVTTGVRRPFITKYVSIVCQHLFYLLTLKRICFFHNMEKLCILSKVFMEKAW